MSSASVAIVTREPRFDGFSVGLCAQDTEVTESDLCIFWIAFNWLLMVQFQQVNNNTSFVPPQKQLRSSVGLFYVG